MSAASEQRPEEIALAAAAEGICRKTGLFQRAAEGTLCAACLLLAAVPMAATAIVVWLDLGSPILFRQRRAGHAGRNFMIVKFRTMTNERDEFGALLADDLRMTAATRWLRRMRLDELPQLFAVFAGHMSFVGPRPLLPDTIAAMGELGRQRCSVRPGLTGWSQVSGNTRLSLAQKLSLDIWYVRHRTIALDLRILLETAFVLARGERVLQGRVRAAETEISAFAEGRPVGPRASVRSQRPDGLKAFSMDDDAARGDRCTRSAERRRLATTSGRWNSE